MSSHIQLKTIGVIRSSFKAAAGTPIQPPFGDGVEGTVEVLPEYAEGLADLDGFDRIWLLYWLDRAPPARLRVMPFRDNVQRGLFATRAPCRPNPIGLSSVRLIGISDNMLTVSGIDILDGTPLLDIKPYIPAFDAFMQSRAGWFDNRSNERTRADGRFSNTDTGTCP
jgi:tRNA-Thr(GGU) m(6)t(6)A37 methyltransferase TsaA